MKLVNMDFFLAIDILCLLLDFMMIQHVFEKD